MAGILTADEIKFLERMEQRRIKHIESQAKYRASNKSKIAEYNKHYYDGQQTKLNEIKQKQPKKQPQPTPINIQQIAQEPVKIDKRTRRGKTQKTADIEPHYKKRTEPLEYSTIDEYMKKSNVIHNFFMNKSLSSGLKAELKKLFNDNPNIDENLILIEMPYINNDIEPTITALREYYKKDNTLKSYINILVVITAHLKTLNKSVYQTLTKLNIHLNKVIQEKREENKLEEGDENKIIDLNKTIILSNLHKLTNIRNRLIYGLYTLFPARREEWRFTKLTTETDKNKLNDSTDNYLIVSTNPKRIIFNNYKTYKTYGQQDFTIDDYELDALINEYIVSNDLMAGDYLFHLQRNRDEIISQPNFSRLVSDVFNKIYDVPISIRFLRMSHISNLLKTNPSIKQMKELAKYMANSLDEQRRYNKLLNN